MVAAVHIECAVTLVEGINPSALYALHMHCFTQKPMVDFETFNPWFWLLCGMNREFDSLKTAVLSR